MDRTGSSRSEEMLEVRVDTFQPLIQTFFERMTEEQWTLLKSGSPDDATRISLAELLLEIIQEVTHAFLEALQNTHKDISEERVQGKLRNVLDLSFAEALGIMDQVQCVSSDRLTNLLAKEVTESVSAAHAAALTADPEIHLHVTPPCRLNNMLHHASKMLSFIGNSFKVFNALKKLCKPRARRQRVSRTASPQTIVEKLVLSDLEDEDDDERCRSPDATVEAEDSEEEPQAPEEEPPQDPFVASTATVVQAVIQKAVTDITEPLLQDVADSEYELLQSESSFDIEVVSKDITHIITSEVKTSSPESTHKHKMSLKAAGSKIRTFFATCFAKASIHRMVGQLKAKFHHESEAESSQSMQSLIADIDSLFQAEDGDQKKEKGGNELCVFPRYKTLSGTNVVVLTKELTDRVYCYIRYGTMMPHIIPQAIRRKVAAVPQVNAAMYDDIQRKVCCFLALINWWQKTQAASHSDRVTLALEDAESVAQRQASKREETRSRSSQEVDRNKMCVRFLVLKLVSRLYNKAEVNWIMTEQEVIIQPLIQRIWAEVGGTELRITPKMFKDLDKAVFKDLVKVWGCATNVLVSMNLEEPAVENFITSCFIARLMAPAKKRSTISRFFSSSGKALSKPFRWSHRARVI